MSLEKRVEELEKEVALLKAQIQTTLLDIQEQLANQVYPALRGDEPAPSSTPGRNGRKPQSDWEPEDASRAQMKSPLRQVRITEDDLPIDPDPPTQPAVVRAKKVLATQPEPPPAPRSAAPRPPTAPASKPAATARPQNGERQAPAPQRPAAQPNGRAVSPKPQPQAAPQPKARPAAPPAPRPTPQAPAPAANHKAATADQSDIEEQSNLVLRLIAGIHNAGAGITKKRSNYG